MKNFLIKINAILSIQLFDKGFNLIQTDQALKKPVQHYQTREPYMSHQIIKLPEVLAITQISKATVYSEIKKGNFPKPIKLGDRAVAWVMADVREWLDNKIQQSKKGEAA